MRSSGRKRSFRWMNFLLLMLKIHMFLADS